jgi:hypothetical protein
MKYTFWHCGILIGESRMRRDPGRRRHLSGSFDPTPYGLELFPRLTGILTAGHELKSYLDANGLSPDEMSREEIETIFETIPAGQKVIDIGRTLSEVEMRDPDGKRLEFVSIGFSDLLEFKTLAREMDRGKKREASDLPPGVSRYVVSATLSKKARESIADTQAGRLGGRGMAGGGGGGPRWSSEN